MSIAMQDDLDQYLSAHVRVVSVDTPAAAMGEIIGALGGAGLIELRRPHDHEDPTEWCHLVTGLSPHLLVVAHDDGLLDRAGWTRRSRRNPLMRVGGTDVSYEWRSLGDHPALVVTGSGPGSLDALDADRLHTIGTLARGLVAAG